MGTNVIICQRNNKLPAGLFKGTEVFVEEYEIYAMYRGRCILFEELPSMEKRFFVREYLADKAGQKFIREELGITGFESAFRQWLFCKFGAIDGEPDLLDGKVIPDLYNSACDRKNCPGRGVFCGQGSRLKRHDVETLHELVSGYSVKQMADHLHLSDSAIKSRIEKLKERMEVPNVAALAAKAVELGIYPIQ